MGVMSRRVVPACGNLCCVCPALRASSRHPVKRYKKLLADIFPRNQEAESNDRKIGKLCDYASKNPLRIPKITDNLEQICYKDLRNEVFGSVKVVLCIYKKFLSSCKEQMPLFAGSLLEIVRTLLEQTRTDEIRILGCNTLFDFIDCQKWGKMNELYAYVQLDYKLCPIWCVSWASNHIFLWTWMKDTAKDPAYWSKACLYNMVKLAREATTLRRVLEPLFHYFDTQNQWSSEKEEAARVLMYLQSLLEDSGDNYYLLLSILVKHLDHKNVSKQPILQIKITNTITQLAQNVKQQGSVTIIGAISDLIKHLRKCLQTLGSSSSFGNNEYTLNTELQSALEMCILQLSNKVGDVGPILDLMAVVLENISTTTIVARTTIYAVYQTAKLVTSIPNTFPDALFHQLLLAMAHPDIETRIGAHSVFSTVLMPSPFSPQLDHRTKMAQKVPSESFSVQHESFLGAEQINRKHVEGGAVVDVSSRKYRVLPYRVHSFSGALNHGKDELSSFRLSSHQVSLLLSSIWVQATSMDNGPANFEAMAHTFSIALLFTRSKTSSYMALVRCFQLAFSLMSISLDQEGQLISVRNPQVDPFLELVDDVRLQAVNKESEKILYGSQEDDVAAIKSLSAIELDDKQLKETVISYFLTKYSKLPEDELSSIKKQLAQGFSPDDAYPLGPPLFMETPRSCSPIAQIEFPDFDEIVDSVALMDEETELEPIRSQSSCKSPLSFNNLAILSVNQLLESVLETARQVASFPISETHVPYDQMKNQCEALVSGKQQKMSVLHSFKHQQDTRALVLSSAIEAEVSPKTLEYSEGDLKLVSQEQLQALYPVHPCSYDYRQHSLRLPPASPYDKFLKAAGC
ncbi:hypothetical protein TSUD_88830 [Trifolium subterraneum]|uniref:Uncharacterized protein n=1 Tax=Trifolium subterraneum TaxID=3900 RepID=A0A2Z6P448_TRISU|nr:hypothetical protein TSUD_88830 [Trifolium subterraneum]